MNNDCYKWQNKDKLVTTDQKGEPNSSNDASFVKEDCSDTDLLVISDGDSIPNED